MLLSSNFGSKGSKNEKQKLEQKSLQIFLSHLQKQLSLQQIIQKDYQNQVNDLDKQRTLLLNLIEQSCSTKQIISKQIKVEHQIQNESFVSRRSKQIQKKGLGKDRSQLLKNESKLISKQTQKQKILPNKSGINYMNRINQLKNKDLKQEVNHLLRELNLIVKKSQFNYANKSKVRNNNKTLISEIPLNEKSEQYFVNQNILCFGQIDKLPTASITDNEDQVVQGLIQNLKKQEQKLLKYIYHHKQLLTKKSLKQTIQQRTIQNLRLVYKQKKKQEYESQNILVKSNKDIIKFGYTQQMIRQIRQKIKIQQKNNH